MQNYHFFATAPGRPLKVSGNDVYYDRDDEFTLTPDNRPYVVEMVVELSHYDFGDFDDNPIRTWDFISENQGYSFFDSAGSYHGILVLGEGYGCGYILDPDGNYRAFVPFARSLMERVYPQEQNMQELTDTAAENQEMSFTQSM